MDLSIIVPTYNEAPNIRELVRRVTRATEGMRAEIIFVDDSRDDTPAEILRVAQDAAIPVRLLHRDVASGGLGGAVVAGMHLAESDTCLVMDGDLQHPPEKIPELAERMRRGDVDVVVASRYTGDGTAHGLADRTRVWVSRLSTALTRAMFPVRLRSVADPMTGYFVVDRRAIDDETLNPRGFKILLEILARTPLRVAEVPFDFAGRFAGESKASLRQGMHFLVQLAALRFGKMSLFAIVGGLGAIANVLIVWALVRLGVNYVVAAVIAAEVTIVANFLLMERFVFQDMKGQASRVGSRFAKSFAFNNAEALVRLPIVAVLVSGWHWSAAIATAVTLLAAFFVRFLFHALVVYAPKRPQGRALSTPILDELDRQAVLPGEL
ncbi:glycosyltransferase [Microbacterium sp. VKM Ac-2870]|uniref:glycosyltransferase n=1 Tax=Microbacterium sp. VKM Ac-2870 TaxID=2783825 RepID=UPI00188D7A51|nr:glycosyltransferase [Microbacterium sp. VKM Ac-2870]MBF4562787.1 glycosyltransferase [Microbacterium sp. VKM Ac-2870]